MAPIVFDIDGDTRCSNADIQAGDVVLYLTNYKNLLL